MAHASSDPPALPPAAPRPPGRRARWIGALVAIATLAALGWLAWSLTRDDATAAGGAGSAGGAGGGRGPRGIPAPTVAIAAAERADIPVTIEALGTVTPAATVTVRPQVSGVLQELPFREGQTVKAGQLLAQIDPRPFEMALMQAVGQRQRDEAQLENAKLTLQRYRTLLQQDSIARQDVDTQAALVRQLEAALVTDRANEGTARLNLGYTRVVAPISGRLGLRVVDVGNLVGPNDANGIAVITQLVPIDVEFALPQDRVPELQQRQAAGAELPVVALDRTRSRELARGRFAALDNLVDTQTGTVRAKARFANEGLELFPSQFVNVRLLLRTIEGAVVVPVSALRQGAGGDFVYVLDAAQRTVSLRRVTRGETSGDKVQIASGLEVGEQVITEGADRLRDGARVVLPGDRPASGANGGQHAAAARGAWGAGRGASGVAGASGAAGEWQRRRAAAQGSGS